MFSQAKSPTTQTMHMLASMVTVPQAFSSSVISSKWVASFDCYRNSNFACSNKVDRYLIAFEYFEHFTKKSGRTKHSAGANLYYSNVIFCCNGFDFSVFHYIIYNSAICIWFYCILQPYRYSSIFCRLNTGGVEYLCTKISKF